MTTSSALEHYRGELAVPSENERHGVSVELNSEDGTVTLKFDEPVAGSSEWVGQNVLFMDRPKYQEIQFATFDLPQETVELTWKMNKSKLDNTIAGVVVAKPNSVRVRGEKGYILTRA